MNTPYTCHKCKQPVLPSEMQLQRGYAWHRDCLGCEYCNPETAVHRGRATMLCGKCGKDISMQYFLWAESAHPEWFLKENVK